MHTSRSWEANAALLLHSGRCWEPNRALLLQGLCICPNNKVSDSCFTFTNLIVTLPVYCLHHTDGGYSSLISTPTWVLLPASSPLNTPRLQIRKLGSSSQEEPQLRSVPEGHFSGPEYSAKCIISLRSYFSARGSLSPVAI